MRPESSVLGQKPCPQLLLILFPGHKKVVNEQLHILPSSADNSPFSIDQIFNEDLPCPKVDVVRVD
jgi:hypothetical protein